MEMGQKAFSEGSYEEAADRFIDAFSASPFPAFIYNAALSYEKSGSYERAADFYSRYLDAEPKAPDADDVREKIASLLRTAKAQAAAAAGTQDEPPAPEPEVSITELEMKSLISVRTNPPDARIKIVDEDGDVVASLDGDAAQTVVKGSYTIEASHPNFRTVETKIHVTAGQVYVVVVEMSQGAFLGFLRVTSDVPSATVHIDNRELGAVGTTPWGNVLPTGPHTVWVGKPGFETVEETIELELGREHELFVELERLHFGTLEVKTNVENAQVYVGSRLVGDAPLETQLPPGKHAVTISAEDMKSYETIATVEGGKSTKLLVRMNPKPSRSSAWVSASVGAALLAAGGVTGGFALKNRNELRELRRDGRLADDDPRIQRGFLLGLGADVAFGLGAVVAGVSIYYFLRDPLPPSEGKIVDPVDFEKNPEPAAQPEEPSADVLSSDASTAPPRPTFVVAPLAGPHAAGLGLSVAF